MFKSFNIFNHFSAKENRLIHMAETPDKVPEPPSAKEAARLDQLVSSGQLTSEYREKGKQVAEKSQKHFEQVTLGRERTPEFRQKADRLIQNSYAMLKKSVGKNNFTQQEYQKLSDWIYKKGLQVLKNPSDTDPVKTYYEFARWIHHNIDDSVSANMVKYADLRRFFDSGTQLYSAPSNPEPPAVADSSPAPDTDTPSDTVQQPKKPKVSLDQALAAAKQKLGPNAKPSEYADATHLITNKIAEEIARVTGDKALAKKVYAAFQTLTIRLDNSDKKDVQQRYQYAAKLAQAYDYWLTTPKERAGGSKTLKEIMEAEMAGLAADMESQYNVRPNWQGLDSMEVS